jgi:NADH-quinone oxidoreductase subunit N
MFIAAGYATEAAVVPFHVWLPDAYVAAPASSTAFISSLIDQGSYYILLRVFVYILTPPEVFEWRVMMAIFSAITMITANLAALTEKNIKRLFAYVGIADVGYNLVAITSVTQLGILGNLYFFLNGGMTIALAFMVVGVFNHMGVETLDDINGIGRYTPNLGLALVIGTLSFIGFPPTTGFVAKFMVFTAAIEANLTWLAIIGVLTSAIQAIYLINLYMCMFYKPATKIPVIKEPKKMLVPIYIFLGAIIFLGIFPQFVFDLINPVAAQFPFIP